MKDFNRWFSVLMCLCMLATSTLGDAAVTFAEESAAIVSAESQEGGSDADLSIEAEPVLELSGEETETEQNEVSETNGADDVAATTESQTFTFGYARLLGDAPLYALSDDAVATEELERDGIVLAVERRTESGLDRLCVAFVRENAASMGWVNASCLSPMSEAEIDAFQDGITEAICYQDNVEYPLAEVTVLTAETEPVGDNELVSMRVENAEMSLSIGETAQLEVIFSDGVSHEVGYALQTSGVVSIDESGAITALAAGSTMVSIICQELALTDSVCVTVGESVSDGKMDDEETESIEVASVYAQANAAPAAVSVDADVFHVIVGRKITLPVSFLDSKGNKLDDVYTYRLESANPRVATVNTSGEVTAVSAGWTEILVMSDIGLSTKCQVGVVGPATNVTLSVGGVVIDDEGLQIGEGMTRKVDAEIFYSATGSNMFGDCDALGLGKFSVGNAGIATVDAAGNVTGLRKGETTLTFSPYSGKTRTVKVTVLSGATQLYLNKSRLELGVGESEKLTVKFSQNGMGPVTFASSDERVALVAEDGTVTARSVGTAVITAQSGKAQASCTVDVHPVPSDVRFAADVFHVISGRAIQLPLVFLDENGNAFHGSLAYSLTSSNADVAVVSDNGTLTARGNGWAEITLTTADGLSATCQVCVVGAITELTLSADGVPIDADGLQVGVGMSQKVSVRASDGSTSFELDNCDYLGVGTFSTGSANIATVDECGNVAGRTKGETTLTFSAFSGLNASVKVTVLSQPTALSLNKTSLQLGIGKSEKLIAVFGAYEMGAVTFSTSDAQVATVTEDGTVTAKTEGTAVITAKCGALEARCAVEVLPAPSGVRFAVDEIHVISGRRIELPVVFLDKYGDKFEGSCAYSLTSNQPRIAETVGNGMIAAGNVGWAEITLTTENGLSAKCRVGVIGPATDVVLSSDGKVIGDAGLEIGEDASCKVDAEVFYSAAGSNPFGEYDFLGVGQFSVGNASIAAVDALGNVTGLRKGETTLTFTPYSGKAKTIRLTVSANPVRLYLNRSELSLGVGMTEKLIATFSESGMGPVTFTSSNERVASVAEDGTVRAKSEGTAVITARSGKAEASCTVEVQPAPFDVAFEADVIHVISGRSIELPVVFRNEYGDVFDGNCDYILKSSSADVAEVSADGRLTAGDCGWAEITLTAWNGLSAKCDVCVVSAVTSVALSADGQSIETQGMQVGVGMSRKVSAQLYDAVTGSYVFGDCDYLGVGTFSVGNASIATVDVHGNVKGLRKGSTTLTFTAYSGTTRTVALEVLGEPTAVYLNKSSLTLGAMMSGQLSVSFNANELGAVTFESSDPSVVSVDQTGNVVAVAPGRATVTVRTANGKSDTCAVTVLNAPDEVSLSATAMNVPVGKKFTLNPVATYEGGIDCMAAFAYFSDNSGIVAVSSDGTITANAVGMATVRVMTQNDLYIDCAISVQPAAQSIALTPSACTLGVGQTTRLTARINHVSGSFYFGEGDYEYAAFSSQNENIATIDPVTGVVTAVSAGTTNVRLLATNGVYALCKVEVVAGPDWLEFSEETCELGVGQVMTLNCDRNIGSLTSLTFASSDPKVVSVVGADERCTLTALGIGVASVTATASNGKNAICTVSVKAAPERVDFGQDTMTVGVHETRKVPEPKVTSSKGECSQRLTYTANNTNVVVSSDGQITGVSAGTTTITATTYNGVSDTISVRILPEPDSISLTVDRTTIAVGERIPLKVQVDAPGTYAFSMDKNGIVKISDGVVTALKTGTVRITVTTYNGLSDSLMLTVKAAPDSITLDVGELELGIGMTRKLTASIPEGTLGTWSFASSDPSVATVDDDGIVTAVTAGTVEITVSVNGHEDVFDICNLTVLPMPAKIILSATELSLKTGATAQLTATLTDADGRTSYGKPVFTTSNAKVATVVNGKITAVASGSAVITVSTDVNSAVKATCVVTVSDANVRFDESTLRLGVGESYKLNVIVPQFMDDYAIVSSNPKVATVDSNGNINAIAEGTTTIMATNGGDRAECAVTVAAKPESVQLGETSRQLVVGETFKLSVTLLPQGSASKLTFSSENSSVATVGEDGTVTAMGYGSTRISVRTYDDSVYAVCTVKVVYEPELVRFGELNEIVIAVGDSYTLEEPVMYHSKGECNSSYVLTTSNTDCVRISMVNDRHVLKALSEGDATLRIKTANGITASLAVSVVAEPASIHFADEKLELGLGESYAPVVLGDNSAMVSCMLTSGNTGVVRIENGQLSAVSEGSAVITATSRINPALTVSITATVLKAPRTMRFDRASYIMPVGETTVLTTSFDAGSAAKNVTFVSSDESVIQVDRGGFVRAVGVGTATVTGTTFNGCTATCAFTVKVAPTEMTILPEDIVACVKDSVQLDVRFGSDEEYANVVFESSNEAVAAVSDDGLVTFRAIGEAVIYAGTFNGLSAQIAVTVCETPSSVRFQYGSAVILRNDRAELNVLFDKGAGYYTLKSSAPDVVRVAADGSIDALKLGKSTIMLTMPGLGLSTTCTIEVVSKLDGITVAPEKDTILPGEQTPLGYSLLPNNAIGTGLVSFESDNPDVATVDSETGIVTGVSYGTATLRVVAGDGSSGECEVSVLGGKRRMLVAYYFGESGDVGYLPFAFNNGTSMAHAFSYATVEGQSYDIVGALSNPTKETLFATMDDHFADATDDDVSVIYLLAHGAYDGQYFFSTNKNDLVYGYEIMDHLEKIKGKVVMIMDSCYSGGLIMDGQARSEAQGGRIAILTSSHHTTNSCYWDVSIKRNSVDFFTFAFLYGLGFNENGAIAPGWGFFTSDPPADTNGDGLVTVQEAADYAKTTTVYYISNLAGSAQFRGNPKQVPNSYISDSMKDLVLYAR